jgi:hypothetical protein
MARRTAPVLSRMLARWERMDACRSRERAGLRSAGMDCRARRLVEWRSVSWVWEWIS